MTVTTVESLTRAGSMPTTTGVSVPALDQFHTRVSQEVEVVLGDEHASVEFPLEGVAHLELFGVLTDAPLLVVDEALA